MSVPENGDPLGASEPWPAPAKLNLCLHIVGRRPDGYHLLQSAMQFVDVSDELRFYGRPAGLIERLRGASDVRPDADLVVRAARLLADEFAPDAGVAIDVVKQVPMQGGLGGGSSDAATTLVALSRLWNLRLDIEALARLGLALGADVPFFVRGQAAWVEGIGERQTSHDFAEGVYVIIKPAAAVSTSEIFQAPELTRNSPVTTIRAFLAAGGRNDCTSTVRGRYPEIAEALDWLQNFGEARLTGTGACVFAAVVDEACAARVVAQAPRRWRAYVAHSLNRSPLLERLAREHPAT
jgi:4-diphosphocytidyl-2-C-methyl-D-erythritol kinase